FAGAIARCARCLSASGASPLGGAHIFVWPFGGACAPRGFDIVKRENTRRFRASWPVRPRRGLRSSWLAGFVPGGRCARACKRPQAASEASGRTTEGSLSNECTDRDRPNALPRV